MPQVVFNGITFNFVTVVGQVVTGEGGAASGNVLFTPTDIAWSAVLGLVASTAAVGATLNANGQFAVELFAMDNPGVSTNWQWELTGEIMGTPLTPRRLTVNHANGDMQNITVLLDASIGIIDATATLSATGGIAA